MLKQFTRIEDLFYYSLRLIPVGLLILYKRMIVLDSTIANLLLSPFYAITHKDPPQQEHQTPQGRLRHPCVICLIAEAMFIALFCCHLSACAECVQTLRVNGVRACPICREPAIFFYEFE